VLDIDKSRNAGQVNLKCWQNLVEKVSAR
jgi:hypothetical protein